MNESWEIGRHFIESGLSGMAAPWVIASALVLTSFLLEDVALAAGAVLAANGTISWEFAFIAVAGGISVGDVGLYGVGRLCIRFPLLRHRYIEDKKLWARDVLLNRLASMVLLARVIPGLRLLTYTASGFLRIPFIPFAAWVFLAVSVWTIALFWFSSSLGHHVAETLDIPVPVAVGLIVIVLALSIPVIRYLRKKFL
jgi:membrane protein DedA with SNARE-associated domain